MCCGYAYLDIRAEIDIGGLPLPRMIHLPDGRQLDAAAMSVAPVITANGIECYRYELWIGDATHIVYLQNSLPLRWYVEVELPFGEPASPAFPLATAAD